jgi:hypothetical protein
LFSLLSLLSPQLPFSHICFLISLFFLLLAIKEHIICQPPGAQMTTFSIHTVLNFTHCFGDED